MSVPGIARAAVHVSVSGNDGNSGNVENPFRTITKAASVAGAGDTVTIHAGTYRERVTLVNGGGEGEPITFRAAEDGEVIVKGSDVYDSFQHYDGTIWRTDIDQSGFSETWNSSVSEAPYTWNPFTVALAEKEGLTCGAVYVNGALLPESTDPDVGQLAAGSWKADSAGTGLYINLGGSDPNAESVEVAVREELFAPGKKLSGYGSINHITVEGITFSHTAAQFHGDFETAPTTGALNIFAGHGWIIDHCTFSDVKTAGIATGIYNFAAYIRYCRQSAECIDDSLVPSQHLRAGYNVFSNNLFRNTGSNGIISLWDAFSEAYGNTFINTTCLGFPYHVKTGAIKLMYGFDWHIHDNYFKETLPYNTVWVDVVNTGVRVHDNVFAGGRFWYEMGHGPVTVYNNVFLDALFWVSDASGIRTAHNLFYNTSLYFKDWENRVCGFYIPHTGIHDTSRTGELTDMANNLVYNNIFIMQGIDVSGVKDTMIFYGNDADYNVFYDNAQKSGWDTNSVVSGIATDFGYTATESEVVVNFNLDASPWSVGAPLINNENTGPTPKQGQSIDITVNTDFFGTPRDTLHPVPGCFADMKEGANSYTVWPKTQAARVRGNGMYGRDRYSGPSISSANITFDVINRGRVVIAVYDLHGRMVVKLADGIFAPGRHALAWDGYSRETGRMACGTYMLTFKTEGYERTARILLLNE